MVDLQIHGVSEPTRRTLSAEAKARGEPLQEYLLDVLDREAHEIDNRGLLVKWTPGPLVNEAQPVGLVTFVRSQQEGQGAQLARRLM